MSSVWQSVRKALGGSKKNLAAKENATPDLFSEITVGDFGTLSNRVAMAPMTRARATNEMIVGKHHVDYYTQRATAGLLISEGTFISKEANGWWCAPGIFTEEQTEAWKPVVDSVHNAGGKIVCQLWHCGRASHSDYQVDNKPPVAPSAIAAKGDGVHVPGDFSVKPYEVPRALETDEIPRLIQEYVHAAKNAVNEAGFDGIEIHGANGYLLDTFMQSESNKRTDQYGGSVENRLRIIDELLTALIKEIPAGKIGIRYGPNTNYNGTGSPDNVETFSYAIEVAAKHKIAYVHVCDGLAFGFHEKGPAMTIEKAREVLDKAQGKNGVTKLICNCGYTKESGEKVVKAGSADMVAYGRAFITNPDLVRRFKEGIALTEKEGYDHLYAPGAEHPEVGFTDFPAAK